MSVPMTDKFRLVEAKLGASLAEYLRRAQEDGSSLRRIAADLTEQCSVEVSYETVRVWLAAQVAAS